MRLKSIQAPAFKSLFEVLKEIINDVNIYFDASGFHIKAFDTARVTLVNVFMDSRNFEEYECSRPVIIGVNMSNIFKLIKSIGNNDIILLENTDENLNITISNASKKTKSTFNLKLLDLNEETIEIPEISGMNTTIVHSLDFQKLVRDMLSIGTDMTIYRHSTVIEFSCDGDFANQCTIIDDQTALPDDVTCKGTYSLKYISMFIKSTSMCPLVQILQSDDDQSPIIFKYSIANLGEIHFYLAEINE
jgi:proliferating cell nuclear antigen